MARASSQTLNRSFARLAASVVFCLTGLAAAHAAQGSAAQRLACTSDAFRLCFSEMPDSDAVKACMITNKAQLSDGCRATFKKETAAR